jgi:hypothetical protein
MNAFAPPPHVAFDIDIDADQAAFFTENGYLALDRVTTDEELEWLRNVYDTLLAMPMSGFPDRLYDAVRPYGSRDAPILGQLLFPEQRVPAIRQTALWRNAQRIAQRLLRLPENEIESWGHIVHKPARHGAATPWHQDEAYWAPELLYYAVGSWLPLDDAVDTAAAVPVPLTAGGMSFHHPRTLHYAGPNGTDRPRCGERHRWPAS